MARENGTAVIYAWHEVSFPLWHEPRPQIEFLREVEAIIQKHLPWDIISNLQRLIDSGDRNSWVEWKFASPISEETRGIIQKALVDFFGEAAGSFRWSGARTTTKIEGIYALGPHIQSGTQPC